MIAAQQKRWLNFSNISKPSVNDALVIALFACLVLNFANPFWPSIFKFLGSLLISLWDVITFRGNDTSIYPIQPEWPRLPFWQMLVAFTWVYLVRSIAEFVGFKGTAATAGAFGVVVYWLTWAWGFSPALSFLVMLAWSSVFMAVTVGALFKFGQTRSLFLAPAFLFFAIFVVYPIGGSAWISLHDAYDDQYVCADGRTIKEAAGDATCRRVLDMEWRGLGQYQDLFIGDWDEENQEFKGLAKDRGRLTKSLGQLGTWTWSSIKNIPPRTYNLVGGWFGAEPYEIVQAKKPSYPRLSSMWESMINNALWLIMFQVAIPIGLAIAVLLNQSTMVNRLIKPMFFFPFVIAPAVVAFLFQFFYNPDAGPLVGFYDWMGWGANGILGTNGWSNFGIIFAAWYPQIAYCIIIYLAGLTAINPELIEAGSLDGAKGFRLFRLIIMPQLWPATFICMVVTTIGALRSFDLVQVMTVGQRRSEVMARYMFDIGFGEGGGNYGKSAAISMVLFAFMLIFIVIFVTRMVRQTEED